MSISGRSWVTNTAVIILALSVLTGINYALISLEPRIGRGFLIPWVANRFLLEGKSPYNDETSQKIEELAYHQADLAEERELRFVMPLYASIVMIPFSLIPEFNLARAVWLSVSELLLLLSSFLILKLTEISYSHKSFYLLSFIFSSIWYFSLFPVINGHVVILVSFFLILTIFLIKTGYDEIAAAFLALSFIKPHLVWLIALFILIWMLAQQRWQFFVWFISIFAILVIVSFIILPDWLIQYLREFYRYAQYNRISINFPTLITPKGGLITRITPFLSLIVGILLFIEWVQSSKSDFMRFLWVISLTLCISLWLTPKSSPGNYILLTLPLLLFFSTLNKRLSNNNRYFIYIFILVVFLYSWIGAFYPFLMSKRSLSEAWFSSHQQWFPLLLLVIILLYWIRWWITSKRYPQLEDWKKEFKRFSSR